MEPKRLHTVQTVAHVLGWVFLAALIVTILSVAFGWYPTPHWAIVASGMGMLACWLSLGVSESCDCDECADSIPPTV